MLRTREQIIDALRTVNKYVQYGYAGQYTGKHAEAIDAMDELMATFDREKKKPKGGKKC